MKVGQLFALPSDILYSPGNVGSIKDDSTKTIAKYEVVKIEGELKGRVIVTYSDKYHKRRQKK